MRKLLLVTVIILGLALALTGCGKVRNPTAQSVPVGTANVNPAAGETVNTSNIANTSNTANTPNTAQAENDFSARDTAALLSEIDQELDALFSAMNNFDDVQDADLYFDLQ